MPPAGLVISQKYLFATLRKPVDSMKKMLLLTLLSLLLLLAGCTIGIKQTPKAVRQAFDALFPGATHVEWESVLSTYKAEFYHDGHEKEAQFDKGEQSDREKQLLLFPDGSIFTRL